MSRRWPGDPRKQRAFNDLKTPICMQLILEAQQPQMYFIEELRKSLYNLYVSQEFKNASLFKQFTLTQLLIKHHTHIKDPMQLSYIAKFCSHYMLHSLTDSGQESHDCCNMMATNPLNGKLEYARGTYQRVDLLWLATSARYNLTTIILEYLLDEYQMNHIREYGREPYVESLDELIDCTKSVCGDQLKEQIQIMEKLKEEKPEILIKMMWNSLDAY